MRGAVSALLLVVGLALVGVAVPALWIDRHVVETERWTEAVAPLIAEESVQDQVAEALAAPISDRLSLPDVLEGGLLSATRTVVATDGFGQVWTEAVRLSHQHAVEGLRDEGTGVNLVEDGVMVDRAALVEALRPRLAEAGVPFADRIPDGEGSVVLALGPEADVAVEVVRLADRYATPVAVAAALLLLGGILVARRPARAATVAGVGVVAVAGLLWVVTRLGDNGPLSVVDDQPVTTTVLLWRSLAEPLETMVLVTAVVGGVVAALGAAAWLVGSVAGHRRTRRYA